MDGFDLLIVEHDDSDQPDLSLPVAMEDLNGSLGLNQRLHAVGAMNEVPGIIADEWHGEILLDRVEMCKQYFIVGENNETSIFEQVQFEGRLR